MKDFYGQEVLLKSDFCALELKYNLKTEFGDKSTNGFITLPGKGGCCRLMPSTLQTRLG